MGHQFSATDHVQELFRNAHVRKNTDQNPREKNSIDCVELSRSGGEAEIVMFDPLSTGWRNGHVGFMDGVFEYSMRLPPAPAVDYSWIATKTFWVLRVVTGGTRSSCQAFRLTFAAWQTLVNSAKRHWRRQRSAKTSFASRTGHTGPATERVLAEN